jgi:CubicO group peptidase (beta-lactamase class C family)
MYAALANGGELNGVRLLSTDALKRATQLQGRAPRLAVLPFDMRWRLGYHAIFTTRGIPRAAFGHFGFGGSGAWADPSRELAVAMIVNSGMGTPFGDLRIARISGAALLSVDRRRQRQRARSAFEPRRFRSPLSEVVGLARPAGKRAGTPPGRVSAAGARA